MGCDGHRSSMRSFGANNRLFDMNNGAMLNKRRRVYFKVLQTFFFTGCHGHGDRIVYIVKSRMSLICGPTLWFPVGTRPCPMRTAAVQPW